MNDIRRRITDLITDSSTYQQGRHDERHRLQQLIDVRIDELQAIDAHHRRQLCAELLQLRQRLEP